MGRVIVYKSQFSWVNIDTVQIKLCKQSQPETCTNQGQAARSHHCLNGFYVPIVQCVAAISLSSPNFTGYKSRLEVVMCKSLHTQVCQYVIVLWYRLQSILSLFLCFKVDLHECFFSILALLQLWLVSFSRSDNQTAVRNYCSSLHRVIAVNFLGSASVASPLQTEGSIT